MQLFDALRKFTGSLVNYGSEVVSGWFLASLLRHPEGDEAIH